jgi:C4-dicarboxylate-specific signal transduction histidine kinase
MNSELINHGVAVRTSLADGLPIVRGDRVQLQQVLINLLVNASDAMSRNDLHDRKITVSTALADDGAVRVSVADNGCGIAPGRVEEIFEPFHTTKSQGLGLGLTVCRTIMSAHGGTLRGSNNADRGARFDLDLPRVPVGATT